MSALALRYARAFAQVATAANLDPRSSLNQLRGFAQVFSEHRELREILEDPSIPNEQKLRVLDGLGSRLEISGPVRNLLAVIMDHRRLQELEEVVAEYAAMADQETGLTEVEIVTARPIGEQERHTLEDRAAELAHGRVRAIYSEDASLLGGAVLKIGSMVYDGSLRAQLQELKERMAESQLA